MTHRATFEFWDHDQQPPGRTQEKVDQKFELLMNDPSHPSLHCEQLTDELWSDRVGLDYHALWTDVDGRVI